MTFDTARKEEVQEQFIIVEIDTIEITGTCTHPSGAGTGFGTPLTCVEQAPQAIKTYYFGTSNTPLQYGSKRDSADSSIVITEPIYRVVNNIAENTTEIKPSEGLAGRATASITLSDFAGDPSSINPTSEGTFFGKFKARNIFANKEVRIKYYHKHLDGTGYEVVDALTKTYLMESLASSNNGNYMLRVKDELTKADRDKSQFPIPTNGSLRINIGSATTSIPVDDQTNYAINDVIIIGGEFMRVTAVANILTATATLTVAARGSDIVGLTSLVILSKTLADSHNSDDAIQICHESDNERIDDLLKIILASGDIDPAKIVDADWLAEVDEWHAGILINTLWWKPEDTNKQVKGVLVDFLMDMWYDPISSTIKLSAISVWKVASSTLIDGQHIDRDTLKTSPRESMRFSRAYIYRNKPFLSENDDLQFFKSVTVFKNILLEDVGLYGEPKTKQFPSSAIIPKASAQLLTQRFVSRFGFTPVLYTWTTQEKFLDFQTGDVVNIQSDDLQDIDGKQKQVRGQILKVKPRIGKMSRSYDVKALTYEAAFADGSEFVITGTNTEINLHILAGAPSQVVTLTFIFDAANLCSNSTAIASVVAGNFAVGSVITIILKNGADWQSKGGRGGRGGDSFDLGSGTVQDTNGQPGENGGCCYDAQGIDTDIYITGLISGHTALGTLRAPGGAGAGSRGVSNSGPEFDVMSGSGGGGGAGCNVGLGGSIGTSSPEQGLGFNGNVGTAGNGIGDGGVGGISNLNGEITTAGNGGNWGQPGTSSTTTTTIIGGLAGKGLNANGAVITVHGATVGVDFINGIGDTPTFL